MRRSRVRHAPNLRPSRTWAVVALCTVAACGGPPPPPDAAQTVSSWGATAQLVTDRWEHSAVSRKFTVVTLDRAGMELEKLATQVAQLPDTASGRSALVAGVKMIRADIAALDSAAVHDDHTAAARVAPRLASATAQMDTLGDRLEAQQNQAQSK